ncbi:MAG: hypothetical protein RJB13_2498, partial [Pseudomonadota bacterium]
MHSYCGTDLAACCIRHVNFEDTAIQNWRLTIKLRAITLLAEIFLPGFNLFKEKTTQTKVNTFGTQNNEYRSE